MALNPVQLTERIKASDCFQGKDNDLFTAVKSHVPGHVNEIVITGDENHAIKFATSIFDIRHYLFIGISATIALLVLMDPDLSFNVLAD